MALQFEKKIRRDTPITVRLKAETVKKLKDIAKRYSVSQTDILEKLIEMTHADLQKQK